MRSTFSILPYINRSKVKADGTTAVLCRITIDGKSSTMATGIYCRPEDWNSKTGAIRTVRENNRLQEFRKSVELAYDEILKKQNVVSAELLKNTLAKRAVIPTKLLQMGERERERLLARSKEINSTSTYRHSGYYQKYLKEHLTSLGKEDIEFTDITEDFGNSYKAFLKRYKNFSPSQTNKCLCWLSKLVYLAVDYEILRANPLEDMEYEKKPAPKHRHISRAELKAILETPMLDPLQELGRRAFLFSTFTNVTLNKKCICKSESYLLPVLPTANRHVVHRLSQLCGKLIRPHFHIPTHAFSFGGEAGCAAGYCFSRRKAKNLFLALSTSFFPHQNLF